MWWNTACLIRLSVLYRGRAVPLVWCVRHHGRAQVACEVYHERLDRAARLVPRRCTGRFLADRGCAATALMAHLHRRGWHGRMRLTSSVGLYRRGRQQPSTHHGSPPLKGRSALR